MERTAYLLILILLTACKDSPKNLNYDQNGIRIDISDFINKSPISSEKKEAAINLAKQQQITINEADDQQKTIANIHKESKLMNCLFYKMGLNDGIKMQQNLKSLLLDNEENLNADLLVNSHFNGHAMEVTLPSQAACEN